MGQTNSQKTRVSLVQWKMRPANSLDEIFAQAEYYTAKLSAQKADIIAFPEYFMVPLLANFKHKSEAEAMQKLADFTDQIKGRFSKLASDYKVNIITGSMPQMRGKDLYNVGFLCHRGGRTEQYEKIHIPPAEVHNWGLNGGKQMRTFDTDCGRLGILICYDVEFPELSRILAEEKMEILIVPFFTTTQNGYNRVRHCARARAIENECYVAIVGAVGNLPELMHTGTHYSQSAIFTPCDYAFPADGIQAEASANSEMILLADLDLTLLHDLHHSGSVQVMKDRRVKAEYSI